MDGAAVGLGGAVRPPEEAAGWRLGRGVWTDAVKGRGFVERTGHAARTACPVSMRCVTDAIAGRR